MGRADSVSFSNTESRAVSGRTLTAAQPPSARQPWKTGRLNGSETKFTCYVQYKEELPCCQRKENRKNVRKTVDKIERMLYIGFEQKFARTKERVPKEIESRL